MVLLNDCVISGRFQLGYTNIITDAFRGMIGRVQLGYIIMDAFRGMIVGSVEGFNSDRIITPCTPCIPNDHNGRFLCILGTAKSQVYK